MTAAAPASATPYSESGTSRLAWALVASLALHVVLMATLPRWRGAAIIREPQTLEVYLPTPPAPRPAPAITQPVLPPPEPKAVPIPAAPRPAPAKTHPQLRRPEPKAVPTPAARPHVAAKPVHRKRVRRARPRRRVIERRAPAPAPVPAVTPVPAPAVSEPAPAAPPEPSAPAAKPTAAPAGPPAAHAVLTARQLTARAAARYGQLVSQLLARYRQYPRVARLRGWQGTVALRLHVGPGGKLIGATLRHSSGYDALDQEALDMAKRVPQLPQPPPALRAGPFSVDVEVVFALKP